MQKRGVKTGEDEDDFFCIVIWGRFLYVFVEFRRWTLDAPDALEHEQVNETDKGTIAEQGVESKKKSEV